MFGIIPVFIVVLMFCIMIYCFPIGNFAGGKFFITPLDIYSLRPRLRYSGNGKVILKPVKKCKALFIAPKARQVLYETSFKRFQRLNGLCVARPSQI